MMPSSFEESILFMLGIIVTELAIGLGLLTSK